MPTKVFNILDSTLFSQTTDGVLGLGTPFPDPPDEQYPYTDFMTLIGSGTIDFNVNYNPAAFNVVRSYLNGDIVRQEIDINYRKLITGLPAGSKIKKMVINSPYSINASANSVAPIQPGQRLSFTLSLQLTVNGLIDVNSVTNTVFDPNTEVLLAETITGGAADWVVFDLTAGETYIEFETFIADYERISKWFQLVTLCEAQGGLDFNCHAVLEQGWTITITYDVPPIEWTLGPQIKNQDDPAGTMYSITAGENIDLNTITDVYAYYDDTGIPIELVFTITNVPPNPFDPMGYWIYFFLPEEIPIGSDVIITVRGTQFSGEVEVQRIYAILVDGSGIYKLVPNQAYDIYYNRAEDPITTVNMTIPTPKGRTSYIDG